MIAVPSMSKFIEVALSAEFLCKKFFKVSLQEYPTGNNLETVPCSAIFGKYETEVSCIFSTTDKPRVYRNCFKMLYVENALNYVIFRDSKAYS